MSVAEHQGRRQAAPAPQGRGSLKLAALRKPTHPRCLCRGTPGLPPFPPSPSRLLPSLSPLLSFLFTFYYFPLSPLFSTLLCLLLFSPCVLLLSSFLSHPCFLFFPPPAFSSLFILAWGPGPLSSGPRGSFPLNSTVALMHFGRGGFPLLSLPFPGLRNAQIKHHLLHSSRRRLSILLLWGGRAQWVPGGNVACLGNLTYRY